MKPAILYVRFSSEKQSEGDSEDRQIKGGAAYCRANGLTIVRTIIDKGKSAFHGLHIANGELGKFLSEVDEGLYQHHAFLVEEVDRLSREGNKAALDLEVRLFTGGLEIHEFKTGTVLRDVNDLDSLDRGLINQMRNALAKDDSRKKSIRLSAARQSERDDSRQNGVALSSRLPGWCSGKQGEKVVLIQEHAQTLHRIFDLAGNGFGAKRITDTLNAEKRQPFGRDSYWTDLYVTKILKNRAVLGECQPHKGRWEKRADGRKVHVRFAVGDPIQIYPPVISQSEWNAARAMVDSRNRNGNGNGGARTGGRVNVNSILSPLVYDAANGRRMDFWKKRNDPPYLVTRRKSGEKSNRFRYDRLEESILTFLSRADWKSIASASESDEFRKTKDELNEVLSKLDKAARRLAKMNEDAQDPDADFKILSRMIGEAELAIATLTEQKNSLEAKLEAERGKADVLDRPEELMEKIRTNDRLKLKLEIARRVKRIDLNCEKKEATVIFQNGFAGYVLFRD
jgi:DNA invertase Pin-like site-specific DNA recombinase